MGASFTKDEVYIFIKDYDLKTAAMLLDCGLDGLTLSTSSETEVLDASMAIDDIAIRDTLMQVWRSKFPLMTKEMEDTSVNRFQVPCKGKVEILVLMKHFQHFKRHPGTSCPQM
jgi:hypothetical protein